MRSSLKVALKRAGAAIAVAGGAYATLAAISWCRYGYGKCPGDRSTDSRLEEFFPECEVRERHCIQVAAAAETTFSLVCGMRLEESAVVRTLFNVREIFLGAGPDKDNAPLPGLIEQAKLWGWGVLAENPGREIVFGAVTQPWLARPVFHALSPDEFAAFREPGFAKIAWTLRVDPVGAATSMACTETRVATTDERSRAKFRRYWALVRPGVVLIRLVSLRVVKKAAEASVGKLGTAGRALAH